MADYTELEWSIGIQAPAAENDVYEFRVYDGSTVLDTYALTPQLTVAAVTGTNYDETARSVTITAAVTVDDDYTSGPGGGVNYDETDLPITVVATATMVEQVDYKSNTALPVPIVGTVTIVDQADWKSNVGLSVPVVATVTLPIDQADFKERGGSSAAQSARFSTSQYYRRSSVGLGSTSYTMSAWIYLDTDLNTYTGCLAVESGGTYVQMGTDSNGTALSLFTSASDFFGVAALSVGAWYFVAWSHVLAGTTTMYWAAAGAGSLSSTSGTGFAAPVEAADAFWIAGNATGDRLDGRIAQVKVWTAALNSTEINAEWNLDGVARTSNLWAYYSFRSGPQTADESVNARTLTATGSPTSASGPPPFTVSNGLPISIAATFTAPTQTFTHLGNFSETGLPIPIVSDVTQPTNLRKSFETTLSVPIVVAVTVPTDQADFKDVVRQVDVVTEVTVDDDYAPGPGVATVTQEGFRWRNDDGSQVAATWMSAQDANATLTIGQPVRLRVLLDATGSPAPSTYVAYYKKTTDSTWLPVPVGPGSGSPLYVATSSYITASGEPTTALLTPPSGKTTADFAVGRMWDDENSVDLVDITTSFDPMSIPWEVAHWAEDPAWSHPADGVAVTSWNDATGKGRHATVGGAISPLWRASVAALGNRPAVDFHIAWTALFETAWTAITQPWSLVFIAHLRSVAGGQFTDGRDVSHRCIIGVNGSSRLYFDSQGGSGVVGVSADTTSHLFTAVASGSSSVFDIDGLSIDGNSGNHSNNGLTLNANYPYSGGPLLHEAAFVAVYPGDVRAHANWGAFKTWATTHYALSPFSFTTPTQLPGLQAWYDAADGSTFSYSSGTVVSQWSDKSGNGRHLTQATTSLQPTRSGVQNGNATVAFDGGDDVMATASFTMNQPFTIVSAHNWLAYSFITLYGAGGANTFRVHDLTSGFITLHAGSDAVSNLVFSGVHTFSAVFNGASSVVYRDGVASTTLNPGTGGTTTGFRLGGTGYGYFYEFCIYNRVLSTTERLAVESYLKTKWATP